jgi:hypothetical protein
LRRGFPYGFSRGIPCSAYTTKYPIPTAPAPCALAADTVREECDERIGKYRENEAGEDRDPLQSDEALRLAAELWAQSRQAGRPTAESKALDIDVLIAAQALSFGAAPHEVIICTTNPKHLAQFITAKHWDEILL